ncbi:hypothetical protein E1J17_03560 [Kocuria rosea]|nr:hypothetical protein [Kocuria rosea]THE18940.1 hypothetical protein E1J17_03560 [Kocuria rosea]
MSAPQAMIAGVNVWIDLLTSVLGVATSAVGVVVATGQLTLTARWRRMAAYWREIAEAEGLEGHDRGVAKCLFREAMAKLTAVHLVPGRELLFAASIVVFSLIGAVLFSSRPGNTPLEALTVGAMMRDAPLTFWALLALLIFVWHGIARWSDALYERRRLAQAYLQGESLHRRPVGASGGGQAREALGWRVTVMHFGIAAGLWCLALVYGLVWGISAQGTSEAPEVVSQLLLAATIFLGVSALIYQVLPNRTRGERPQSGEPSMQAAPHTPPLDPPPENTLTPA